MTPAVASSVISPASIFVTSSAGLNNTPGLQQPSSTFTLPVAGGFNPNAISTPQMNTPYNSPSSSSESTEFQFSARHNGLYLYLGRILRPVWLMPLDSIVTSEELISVLDQLNALKRFVHANVHHQTGPYQTNENLQV